ncbi:hypothetical protein Pmani_015311 [Petrolisthes manimaculis]|uniref:Uncharacterized protein n=1 Tax=Petrolisthes manimaculis TaxID=1843537 RepID=A0AAE1PUR8_9EUCA|nr:hypothetical protein Pmani_015311 [Petrolisthes manimaculis]
MSRESPCNRRHRQSHIPSSSCYMHAYDRQEARHVQGKVTTTQAQSGTYMEQGGGGGGKDGNMGRRDGEEGWIDGRWVWIDGKKGGKDGEEGWG